MPLSEYFLDNPILKRELRARLRPRALRGNKSLVYGVYALAAIIVYCYVRGLTSMFRGPESDSRDLFPMLLWGLLVLISLIAPALSATAISQEREQQTWEILAVTRISAAQVMMGKWIGRQLLIGIGFLIVLPFLIGSAIHGGIDAGSAMVSYMFLLLCTNFFTALGLLCSSHAKRTPTATASALVITALLCIGTVIADSIVEQFGLWNRSAGYLGVESPVLWVNPYYAMAQGMDRWFQNGTSVHADSDNLVIGVCAVFMLAFVIVTYVSLLRRFRETERG